MKVEMSFSGDLLEGLRQLESDMKEHVVRPAARAGALVFYEEARRLVPVYSGTARTGIKPGQLRDAIYHVFSEDKSSELVKVYEISWNARKAPHGYLIEYGHWRVNKLIQVNGRWMATSERLEKPVWVPGAAFIRRSYDQAQIAVAAMQKRAAERTAEVLAGHNGGGE
ncbi:HK97 gp10 family phage protein [Cupriavidus basilensis]|uniref:HK97 gp10 family phage protein n=1 Tax=Cupriavidus basilensis TaxID=68895 RepID=A0ABT6AWZ2_9BURK|nr:HK97 gp10 family phage protein [Cupriavidus basilensis]MDF3837150.1 HK97 gp10 family phage protein [Cupriavidus basilensis]